MREPNEGKQNVPSFAFLLVSCFDFSFETFLNYDFNYSFDIVVDFSILKKKRTSSYLYWDF